MCVAATSRPELVCFLVFKTSARTTDVVGCCESRQVCDDEGPHHGDADESDHVHEDHDDLCSASGSDDGLVMCSLFHCAMFSY